MNSGKRDGADTSPGNDIYSGQAAIEDDPDLPGAVDFSAHIERPADAAIGCETAVTVRFANGAQARATGTARMVWPATFSNVTLSCATDEGAVICPAELPEQSGVPFPLQLAGNAHLLVTLRGQVGETPSLTFEGSYQPLDPDVVDATPANNLSNVVVPVTLPDLRAQILDAPATVMAGQPVSVRAVLSNGSVSVGAAGWNWRGMRPWRGRPCAARQREGSRAPSCRGSRAAR